MSAVSTTNSTVAAGLGTLLGGMPEGSGFGGSAGTALSSFGAALTRAERMLDADTDVDITTPSEAEVVAEGEAAAPAESTDGTPPIAVERERQAVPDAGLAAAIAVFAAPPTVPPTGEAQPSGAVEDSLWESALTASDAQAADVLAGTDADAPTIPVAPASAATVRVVDLQPIVATPAGAASATTAPDAPAARAEPVPAPSTSVTAESGAVPVAPAATAAAATAAPKEGGARADYTATPTSAAPASAPVVTVSPTSTPVLAAPDATAAAPRAVAAQIAPMVLNIVQRPVGSHQLTMTVNPDTFGPVTVRAHISAGGEVRVELLGATDAGRDALRNIVTDLRRDLAAVMPQASLTLGSSTSADAGSPDRGAQPGAGGTGGDQASGGRERAAADGRPSADSAARGIPGILPITTRAVSGEGLDILA